MRILTSAVLSSSVFLLVACASNEGATNAERAAPPPAATSVQTSPAAPAGPSVAAPGVSVPQDQPVQQQSGDIAVPGGRETPVPGAPADPRTNSQRMADIRAWDDCVMRAQNRQEADPNRVTLDSPEEICRGSLGMADRLSVPNSRR